MIFFLVVTFAVLASTSPARSLLEAGHYRHEASDRNGGRHLEIIVALGPHRQNVGNLTGTALHEAFSKALQPKGPEKEMVVNYLEDGTIRQGKLLLHVKNDWWSLHKEARHLLITGMAGTVQKMTENPKNCYNVGADRFCNIANRISIGITGYQPLQVFAHLEVILESPTEQGNFDCTATAPAIDDYHKTMHQQWQDTYGYSLVLSQIYCNLFNRTVTAQANDNDADIVESRGLQERVVTSKTLEIDEAGLDSVDVGVL